MIFTDLPSEIIEETWSIYDIVQNCIFPGWEDFFDSQTEIIKHISNVLTPKSVKIKPLKRHIFKIFEMIRPEEIKVVFFGQDPYYNIVNGRPAATGLAFSTWRGTRSQPSVINMFKEIKNDYPFSRIPTNTDLTGWVRQGVFLINTALTVEETANEHVILWKPFTEALIEYIKKFGKHVYIMLGASARKMSSVVGIGENMLFAAHPSPMAADKGFFHSGIFKKCNELLISKGYDEIIWDQNN